jgi:hypothetical protein
MADQARANQKYLLDQREKGKRKTVVMVAIRTRGTTKEQLMRKLSVR